MKIHKYPIKGLFTEVEMAKIVKELIVSYPEYISNFLINVASVVWLVYQRRSRAY